MVERGSLAWPRTGGPFPHLTRRPTAAATPPEARTGPIDSSGSRGLFLDGEGGGFTGWGGGGSGPPASAAPDVLATSGEKPGTELPRTPAVVMDVGREVSLGVFCPALD